MVTKYISRSRTNSDSRGSSSTARFRRRGGVVEKTTKIPPCVYLNRTNMASPPSLHPPLRSVSKSDLFSSSPHAIGSCKLRLEGKMMERRGLTEGGSRALTTSAHHSVSPHMSHVACCLSVRRGNDRTGRASLTEIDR